MRIVGTIYIVAMLLIVAGVIYSSREEIRYYDTKAIMCRSYTPAGWPGQVAEEISCFKLTPIGFAQEQ